MYSSLQKQIRIHTVPGHVKGNSQQRNQGMNLDSENAVNKTVDRNKMLTRSLQLLVGLVLPLYLPYNIVSLVRSYYALHERVNPRLYLNILQHVSWIFILTNMRANAILFGRLNGAVRRYVKELLLC